MLCCIVATGWKLKTGKLGCWHAGKLAGSSCSCLMSCPLTAFHCLLPATDILGFRTQNVELLAALCMQTALANNEQRTTNNQRHNNGKHSLSESQTFGLVLIVPGGVSTFWHPQLEKFAGDWQLIFASCQRSPYKSLKVNSTAPTWHIEDYSIPRLHISIILQSSVVSPHATSLIAQLCNDGSRPRITRNPRNIPVAQPELLSYIFHNAIHVIHVPVTSHRAPHNLPEMHSGWGLAFE